MFNEEADLKASLIPSVPHGTLNRTELQDVVFQLADSEHVHETAFRRWGGGRGLAGWWEAGLHSFDSPP